MAEDRPASGRRQRDQKCHPHRQAPNWDKDAQQCGWGPCGPNNERHWVTQLPGRGDNEVTLFYVKPHTRTTDPRWTTSTHGTRGNPTPPPAGRSISYGQTVRYEREGRAPSASTGGKHRREVKADIPVTQGSNTGKRPTRGQRLVRGPAFCCFWVCISFSSLFSKNPLSCSFTVCVLFCSHVILQLKSLLKK